MGSPEQPKFPFSPDSANGQEPSILVLPASDAVKKPMEHQIEVVDEHNPEIPDTPPMTNKVSQEGIVVVVDDEKTSKLEGGIKEEENADPFTPPPPEDVDADETKEEKKEDEDTVDDTAGSIEYGQYAAEQDSAKIADLLRDLSHIL